MDNVDAALKGLDLSGVVKDLKDNEPAQKVEPQAVSNEPLDLGQFKNPKDLLKSYKEIQAAFTRVTQENKSAKEQLAQLQEQLELAKYQPPYQVPQQHPLLSQNDPDFEIEQRIQKTVATQRIAEILEEESDKNKTEFQERYAYAQMVAREYPQLSSSPRGVKKLFELGDKLRQENLRKNAGKALESLFGEPLNEEEINKLKTLVKGDKQIVTPHNNINNAYMPDTSTSTRTGATEDRKQDYEQMRKDAIAKGDVDGVITNIFDEIKESV